MMHSVLEFMVSLLVAFSGSLGPVANADTPQPFRPAYAEAKLCAAGRLLNLQRSLRI